MDEARRYLAALARDDRSAFDALYLKYAAKTEEFLYRMLKDHSEAEDITQDIFLKIWRNRTSIGAVDAFGPYLFRMARNAVYDRFDNRSVRENNARRDSQLPEYELPDSAIDSRDLLLLIRMVVEKMPEQRRRIFRMSREEGLSTDQIAAQLSLSRRTVEHQISRALAELRKLVKLILFFF